MRAATAPLQSFFTCSCGKSHAAVLRIQGLPILRCPQIKGTAVHLVLGEKGMPLLVTGEVADRVLH